MTLGVEERGLARIDGSAPAAPAANGPARRSRETLSLEPGENRIELVAYNETEPHRLGARPAHGELGRRERRHAAEAVCARGRRERLLRQPAQADLRGTGCRRAGRRVPSIRRRPSTAASRSPRSRMRCDHRQSRQDVRRAGQQGASRDVFVFFLAGHGKTIDGRYYFLPQDFRYDGEQLDRRQAASTRTVQAWFAQVPARKSVLLFDTCESGSLDRGARRRSAGSSGVAALERMTRAMGRTVLSASTDDAPALEGYRGHGVFTYALLDALGRGRHQRQRHDRRHRACRASSTRRCRS